MPSALRYFKLYLKEFPQGKYSPQAYYLLAHIYFLKGEKKNSARTFLLLLEKFPNYALDKETVVWLARYLVGEKDYKNAFFVYDKLQEKFKDEKSQEEAEVGKGEVEILSGSIEKGMKRLQSFLKNHPRSPYAGKALYFLGKAYYGKNKHEEAVECWERASEGGEFAPHALYSLGEHFFSIGSYEQSYRYYLKLAYLYENFPLLPSALHRAFVGHGDIGRYPMGCLRHPSAIARLLVAPEGGRGDLHYQKHPPHRFLFLHCSGARVHLPKLALRTSLLSDLQTGGIALNHLS